MSTYFFSQLKYAVYLRRTVSLVLPVATLILSSFSVHANELDVLRDNVSATSSELSDNELSDNREARTVLDWQTFSQDIDLKNDSQMRQYVAQTSSTGTLIDQGETEGEVLLANFQFIFYPRFQCSPLIKFLAQLPKSISTEKTAELTKKYVVKEMSIDGEPVEYSSLVERREDHLHITYNANLQRRTTLRILVELGDYMRVSFHNGSVHDFSLLGSQKTLEAANAACRNY